MRYVQTLCIQYTGSQGSLSAAAGTLFKGIAIHTFLNGRVALVGTNVDHIERAVILAAHIVAALFHGAVNVRVFLLIHHGEGSF